MTKKMMERMVHRQKPVSWNPLSDCVSLELIDQLPIQSSLYTKKDKKNHLPHLANMYL